MFYCHCSASDKLFDVDYAWCDGTFPALELVASNMPCHLYSGSLGMPLYNGKTFHLGEGSSFLGCLLLVEG